MTLTILCLLKMKYNTQLTSQDHHPGDPTIHQQGQPKHQEDQRIYQENLTISQDQILFCHMENDWIELNR